MTAKKPKPNAHASNPPHGARRGWMLLGAIALAAGFGGLLVAAGSQWLFARERGPTVQGYRVVAVYDHDRNAFCQGLVYDNEELWEGTGKYGQSALRKVDLASGRVLQEHRISARQFGEGITVMGDLVYQITWKARTCYVYDRKTFREVKRFRYEGQGWGLTHDGTHLIMSDGSSALRFIDPDTFEVVRRVWVRASGRGVSELNELEYVDGEIFANVWRKDGIARIDPQTGVVTSWINLTDLYPLRKRRDRENVLNGIAYDAKEKRLFVTGKNWPKLYEIQIVGGN